MGGKTFSGSVFLLTYYRIICVIDLQPLLVERSFLEIMFRGAGDINNPNNILGFEGKINGNENLPGRIPVENHFCAGDTGRMTVDTQTSFFCKSCITVAYLEK